MNVTVDQRPAVFDGIGREVGSGVGRSAAFVEDKIMRIMVLQRGGMALCEAMNENEEE